MAQDLKARVHDFWQANPCGAKFTRHEVGTAGFFDELERHRYETEWHIPEVVQFELWRGRDVLEIGCGLATDAIRFARAGANYTGVDLTEKSIELASRRFDMERLPGALKVADAEQLPFEEDRFDLVYSHGVLHHTPNIERAIDEVHRVLKPGGTAMVMLYHRRSYNYYINIMTLRRMGVRLLRFKWGPGFVRAVTGEDERRLNELRDLYLRDPGRMLNREEFLNQNTDGAGNPLARALTRREAAKMFARFSHVRTEVHFLNKRWIPLAGRLMPRFIERPLGHWLGWHLWIIATK